MWWPVLNGVKTIWIQRCIINTYWLKWNYQLSSNKHEPVWLPPEFNLNMQMVFVLEIKNYESVKIVRMASLNNISLDTPGGENIGELMRWAGQPGPISIWSLDGNTHPAWSMIQF